MIRPWLIVAGDFARWGGMDRANFALAQRLALTGREVHLVAHAVDETLARCAACVHRVVRPWGSHAAGMPLLARQGARRAAQLRGRAARVVVNGGNSPGGSIDWVHYVHAAYDPSDDGPRRPRTLAALERRYVLDRERRAAMAARVVICNSERTQRDVIERLGVAPDRTHVVYYGTEAACFSPATAEERVRARAQVGVHDDRPVVLFVGALGDRRKGFDALFGAWRKLCAREDGAAMLLVAGEGRELTEWERRTLADPVLADRVRFLGYRRDVPALLAAADLLVHPARYEAYGLAVHEAICRGVPAVVTGTAGVAEQYHGRLRDLLLTEVSPEAVAGAIELWRADTAAYAAAAAAHGARLRGRSWDQMSDEIAELVESL